MSTVPGVGFIGRRRERERLDSMLAQARDGRSAVLVLHGEPGIGKTALLRYAVRQASGLRTAEVDGVQAEMELPFAGIERLCAPMLGAIEALPEPQHDALGVALGLSSGGVPDRFLIAVAVLNLLAATAEKRPLLCLVDDAQWLDTASLEALGFVARRLVAEPVAMVFSLREPNSTRALDGLPQLFLKGLDEPDAHAVLASAMPGRLDARVRDRMIAETGGNPLALMELARRMGPSERAAGFASPLSHLPSRLEEAYQRRVAALPTETQRLMLLAAAEPLGDAAALWRAAERLSIDPIALAPATKAGLLEIDIQVRFRHPLVRSAVYASATLDERRQVHEALAEVSDPEFAADRRAWHLALAAAEPDEAVAALLEGSAERAQSRGGFAAAAAFLERAAALTPDPVAQAGRALAAAEVNFRAGEFAVTQRLLAMAESGPLDGFQLARAASLRGHAAQVSAYGNEGASLLLEAARRFEPLDLGLARRTFLTAWTAAITAHHLGGEAVILEVSRAIRALPPLPPDPPLLDLVIEGFALLITEGHAAAVPILDRAANQLLQQPAEEVLRWDIQVGGVMHAMWHDGALAVLERHAQVVRDAGGLAELPIHLQAVASEQAWHGDFSGAERLISEAERISASTGNLVPPFARLRVLALQGNEAEASRLIQLAIREGTTRGQGNAVMAAYWAAAVLYNGLGRHEEAAAAARIVVTKGILRYWVPMWTLFELIEASVRIGDTKSASDALNELAASTQPAGTGLALGIEARCRALLSHGADAEETYREAITQLDRSKIRVELARAHLLFGEWLRGEDRLKEAREQLRIAEGMFIKMGMEAFADRTRRELEAAGAKPLTPQHFEVREELTPQEEQIAHLARDGLTNAEIGGQLFLSRRTVEYHLHKVFSKLRIASRSGLQGALAQIEPELKDGERPRTLAGHAES